MVDDNEPQPNTAADIPLWLDSLRPADQPPPAPPPPGVPLLAYPLWSNLPSTERAGHARHFADLDLALMRYFSLPDLALCVQWLFAQRNIETLEVSERAGGLDLLLFNNRDTQEEFARVYGEALPLNALDDLVEALEGREVYKVRLYTLGAFSDEQRKVRSEFPVFLEFLDGEGLTAYLRETQLIYNSPRVQYRTAWPVSRARRLAAARQKAQSARSPAVDPAKLKAQFALLTQPKRLSEKILTLGLGLVGLAFALSLLAPLPGQAFIPTFLGLAVMVMVGLRLYTGQQRRERYRQLWALLNSSAPAFELGMPFVFQQLGYQVEETQRYQPQLDVERRGSRGILVKLKRHGQVSVAYCACPRMLTAVDIGVCESEMEKHNTGLGRVVTRGVFSAAAIKRAQLDRIILVDGQLLKTWLK